LIGGRKPEVRWFERSDDFLIALVPHLEWFWDHVQRKEMPMHDLGLAATTDVIRRLYPDADGTAVQLPVEAEMWDRLRLKAIERIKVAEKVKREAENRFRLAIGDHTYGVMPNGTTYSNKKQTKKKQVIEESSFRVLRRSKQPPKGIDHDSAEPVIEDRQRKIGYAPSVQR
jgi:predicted phage-related endonuclease